MLKQPAPFPPSNHPSWRAVTVDKGHGRLEKRELVVTSALTGDWPGAKQGFRVRRWRTIRDKTTCEEAFGITSLGIEEATAMQLLEFNRRHWSIENQLHWVRDMTLGEDACRVRKNSAPQILAAFRNAVHYLLNTIAESSLAAAIRQLAAKPHAAIRLIVERPSNE